MGCRASLDTLESLSVLAGASLLAKVVFFTMSKLLAGCGVPLAMSQAISTLCERLSPLPGEEPSTRSCLPLASENNVSMQAAWRSQAAQTFAGSSAGPSPGQGKELEPPRRCTGGRSKHDAMGKQGQEAVPATRGRGMQRDVWAMAGSAVLRGVPHPCRKERGGTGEGVSKHKPKHHGQTLPFKEQP